MQSLLVVVNYVTIDRVALFARNRTGYGYVVANICEELAKQVDLQVWEFSSWRPAHNFSGWETLEKRPAQTIRLLPKITLRAFDFQHFKRSMSADLLKYIYGVLWAGPLLERARSVGYVHVHGLQLGFLPLLTLLSAEPTIKVLMTLHGLNALSDYQSRNLGARRAEIEGLRLAEASKNIYVSVLSNKAKLCIESVYPGLKGRVAVIPNFLESYIVGNANSSPIIASQNFHKLLSVGTICERKNQIQLILDIMQMNQQHKTKVTLDLVGQVDPDVAECFYKLIDECPWVNYHGVVARSQMSRIYSNADILINYSLSEGFGLPILEALANYCHVVVSDKCDLAEDFSPEDPVSVATPGDLDSLHSAIKQLECGRFRKADFDRVMERYSKQAVVQNYIKVLRAA